MRRISLFIDEEQDEKLKKLATAKGISAAELHRRAIDLLFANNLESSVEALDRKVKEFGQRIAVLEKLSHTHK